MTGDDPRAAAAEVSRESLLDILDRTVADHLDWLQSWHAHVLIAPGADRAQLDPHRLCLFGAWYLRNRHAELVDQPMVARLAALHDEMHERAQALGRQ